MGAETASPTQFQPAEVTERSAPAVDNPTFNLSLTSQSFNDTWKLACDKMNSPSSNTLSGFPDLGFCGTESGIRPDRVRLAELGGTTSDALPPGIKFRNVDATPGFQREVQQSFMNVFNSLNPQTQAALKNIDLITASRLNKAIPGEMPAGSAVVPASGEKLIMAEKGIFGNQQSVQGVMKHEFFHLLEDAVKAGKDPELIKAIDTAISRMPPNLKAEFRSLPKRDQDHFRREFMGDSLAMALGTDPKELGYLQRVPNAPSVFKEAIDLLRRKYLK